MSLRIIIVFLIDRAVMTLTAYWKRVPIAVNIKINYNCASKISQRRNKVFASLVFTNKVIMLVI